LGLTAALHEGLGASEEVAFAVALALVFVINFLVLRYFVYPGQTAPLGRQMAETLAASIGFRIGEYLAFLLFHTGFDLPYLPVAAGVLVASFLMKFGFYRQVIFRREPEATAVE
ncbi:MAG: hypothetical protein R3336_06040, partial [Phycisphaeraceae bacterium]|nr:hypothetical protein [Phycisphaeraceae bacterium]